MSVAAPGEKSTTASHYNLLPKVIVPILVVGALLDWAGRFGPIEWLHTIPEIVAARYCPVYSPFTPNLVVREERWIGETAVTGNLSAVEQRPQITFSTDDRGFRLTPGLDSSRKLDLMLTGGASFAYGGGLSDNETFPAVLTQQENLQTFNAGRFFWDSTHFEYVQHLIDELGARKPRAVVYLYWETMTPALDVSLLDALPWKVDRLALTLIGPERNQIWREKAQSLRRRWGAAISVSPVEVLSTRFFKSLANGKVLPNPYAASVVERRLVNDDRILFLNKELISPHAISPTELVSKQGAFFEEYKRRLAKNGVDLYVILLPNKYTLYRRVLKDETQAETGSYLASVEKDLQNRHIPVLNGLTVLAPTVTHDIETRDYAYYRDDHHWSPSGVRRIVAAFAAMVRSGAKS